MALHTNTSSSGRKLLGKGSGEKGFLCNRGMLSGSGRAGGYDCSTWQCSYLEMGQAAWKGILGGCMEGYSSWLRRSV